MIIEKLEEKALKEIPRLQQKVEQNFSRTGAYIHSKKVMAAWDFVERIEQHDLLTYIHSLRTSIQAHEILNFVKDKAKRGDLTNIPIPELLAEKPDLLPRTGSYGGLLHDFGKIQIPKHILNKSYNGEEYTAANHQIVRQHPKLGFDLLVGNGEETELMITGWISLLHHTHQKDPYPLELPPRPSVALRTHYLIDFISRVVAIADRYDSLERVAISMGKKQLNKKEAQEYFIDKNPSDENFIKLLYQNRVFE